MEFTGEDFLRCLRERKYICFCGATTSQHKCLGNFKTLCPKCDHCKKLYEKSKRFHKRGLREEDIEIIQNDKSCIPLLFIRSPSIKIIQLQTYDRKRFIRLYPQIAARVNVEQVFPTSICAWDWQKVKTEEFGQIEEVFFSPPKRDEYRPVFLGLTAKLKNWEALGGGQTSSSPSIGQASRYRSLSIMRADEVAKHFYQYVKDEEMKKFLEKFLSDNKRPI